MGKNGSTKHFEAPPSINITYYSVQMTYTPAELLSLLRQWIPFVSSGIRKRDILTGGLTDELYRSRWNINKITFDPVSKYSFAIAQMRGVMAIPPDITELGIRNIVCYQDIQALVDACKLVLKTLEKTEIEAAFPVKHSKGAQSRFNRQVSAARAHSRLLRPRGGPSLISKSSGRGR